MSGVSLRVLDGVVGIGCAIRGCPFRVGLLRFD